MFSFYSRSHGHCKSDQGKTKTKTPPKCSSIYYIEKGHHLHDLQLELDKAKLVLLVMPNSTIVGAALHVHQLASRRRVHLYRHQWSVVAYAKVMTFWFPLVP